MLVPGNDEFIFPGALFVPTSLSFYKELVIVLISEDKLVHVGLVL